MAAGGASLCPAADSWADHLQPILVAIEGQRLFNELGACLAVRAGAVSAQEAGFAGLTARGDAAESASAQASPTGAPFDAPSDPTLPSGDPSQHVARDLERWFETYADVWRTVSAESELRRIAHVIWRCADLLRTA